ncbi:MAG: low temperature requirement protein A [Acidimicrobiia bacterium]|nr:low temperature requirement protein A [Acidimicrobiia bacterium]
MALTRWQRPALRHEVDDPDRVTWLELFFDLVYVAALIQLGDRLAGDVGWAGVARFGGAFVVLWWTWTGTTAFINRFAGDDVPHRLLTFAQMFAVGTFAVVAASTNVDDPTSWLVAAYLGARIPLLIMYLRARTTAPGDPIINLYLGAFGAGAALWAASLALPPSARLWIWAVALLVEFSAPVFGVHRLPHAAPVHDEHFHERYALFTIIVLGETFVKSISEITAIGISMTTMVFGGLSFTMLIALWWTYFDDVAESDLAPRSPLGRSPVTNRLWWVYLHLPLAAGLTAFGVAAKKVTSVEEFGEHLKASYTWLLVGALIMVLVAVALIDVVTVSPHFGVRSGQRAGLRLVAVAAIALVGWPIASGVLSALPAAMMFAGILVVQIGGEVVIATRADRRVEANLSDLGTSARGSCRHLDEAETPPRVGPSCRRCEEKGVPWVQLRRCLTCGYVGCCDDSPGRHATGHHEATGHPAIATLQPGDDWAYCYDHEALDPNWWSLRSSVQSGG